MLITSQFSSVQENRNFSTRFLVLLSGFKSARENRVRHSGQLSFVSSQVLIQSSQKVWKQGSFEIIIGFWKKPMQIEQIRSFENSGNFSSFNKKKSSSLKNHPTINKNFRIFLRKTVDPLYMLLFRIPYFLFFFLNSIWESDFVARL